MRRPLVAHLEKYFEIFHHRVLFREEGKTYTYGKVWDLATAFSRQSNISGGKIVLTRPNSVSWLTYALGAWMNGNEVVPLSSRLPQFEWERRLLQVRPDLVISSDEKKKEDILFYTEKERHADRQPQPYCLTLYTSGTSGEGSPVRLSDENIISNLKQISAVVSCDMINEYDMSVAILPWSHCYGLTCELLFLITRGAMIWIPTQDFRTCMTTARPTLLFAVPYMVSRIVSSVPSILRVLSRSSVRYTISPYMSSTVLGGRLRAVSLGGAPCEASLATSFTQMFNIPIYQGYGLTEASPMVALTTSTTGSRDGSVGKVLPHIDIRVRDDDELIVRGDNITTSLSDHRYVVVNDKKYLRTGDYGRIDEEGFLYVSHRVSDRIKMSNGFFVDLQKVDYIYQTALSRVCAVIPNDASHSSIGLVIFDEKTTYDLTPTQLVSIGAASHLHKYEIPVKVYVLPLSAQSEVLTEKFTIKRSHLCALVRKHSSV